MSGDCDEALTKLYTYLDSELDEASSEKIRVHLGHCLECGSSFDFEKRLRQVVRERLDEEVPEALVARIREALHREASNTA